MTTSTTEHVSGLDELAAAFRRVNFTVWSRVLRRMAGAGAKVARNAMQAAAPVGTHYRRLKGGRSHVPGTLKRSAFMSQDKKQSNQQQVVYVAGFRGSKLAKKDGYYGPWVEAGHAIVPRRRKSAGRGSLALLRRKAKASGNRVPAHPFAVPSFEASEGSVLTTMTAVGTAEMKNPL